MSNRRRRHATQLDWDYQVGGWVPAVMLPVAPAIRRPPKMPPALPCYLKQPRPLRPRKRTRTATWRSRQPSPTRARLSSNGQPANGAYDFRFRLFDAANNGAQVGANVDVGDITVTDGIFTVQLSFGDAFNNTAVIPGDWCPARRRERQLHHARRRARG